MIVPPKNDRPGSHLEFFFEIQHAHGQKMIDPPRMTHQDLTYNFFFQDSTCTWSKMIDRGGDCYTKELLPARVTTCCICVHKVCWVHGNTPLSQGTLGYVVFCWNMWGAKLV